MTAAARPAWHMRYAVPLGFPTLDAPLLRHTWASADPVRQIEGAAALGFAGIEDNYLKRRPLAEQHRIGEALARHGLEMGCFVHNPDTLRTPLLTSTDAGDRAIMRRELDESVEAAKRVRGRHLTVATARRDGVGVRAQLDRLIDNLKRLAEPAEAGGVTLVLEAISMIRVADLLLDRVELAHEVASRVASPAVKLVLDLFHVYAAERELPRLIDAVWDEVAIIQVADFPGRTELGRGEVDWPGVLALIHDKGYRGLVELEFACSVPTRAGEAEMLARLREIDAAASRAGARGRSGM